jgi:UDP:flavonoid glycosyltransferase YjiC (YdhE family)
VICNGGSGTAYQALAAGVPVLGIPDNMDQYLTMRYVQQAGAGAFLRPGKMDEASLCRTVEEMLKRDTYRMAARKIATEFACYRPSERFPDLVAEWFSSACNDT